MKQTSIVEVTNGVIHVNPKRMKQYESYPFDYKGKKYIAFKTDKDTIHIYEVLEEEQSEGCVDGKGDT